MVYRITREIDPFTERSLVRQLSWASYKPSVDALRSRLRSWLADPAVEICCSLEREISGVLVLRVEEGKAEIVNLGVDPDNRGRGLGKSLVAFARASHPELPLFAETDQEARGFYERLGFSIASLGGKFEGTERFECTLDPPSR